MTDADDFAPRPGNDPPQPPPPDTGGTQAKGFVGALFDFRFDNFVTPRIVRSLYVLITIAIAVGYLAAATAAYRVGAGFGTFMLLIVGPVVSLIYLALARVTLEFILAGVRMSQDIRDMRGGSGRI